MSKSRTQARDVDSDGPTPDMSAHVENNGVRIILNNGDDLMLGIAPHPLGAPALR